MRVILLLALATMAVAAKINPILRNNLRLIGTSNIIVTLADRPDGIYEGIKRTHFNNRGERLQAFNAQLEAHATKSQGEALGVLRKFGINSQSFWLTNQIAIANAPTALVAALEALPSVATIEQEKFYNLYSIKPSFYSSVVQTIQDGQLAYGIEKINATGAWNAGYKGQGIVVANIDTGVRYTHESLAGRLRATHRWYDPNLPSLSVLCKFLGFLCPNLDPYKNPNDPNGHGTHTMGTICGSGGIGVAPEATWIACRGCASLTCTNTALLACGDWIACPSEFDGSAKNCSMAPDVVSNSWGGGQNDQWYNGIIAGWTAAGIKHAFAAGNSGPNCSTANSPADETTVFSIGATDSNDALTSYSSRGPSTVSGTPIKPDVCAPGDSVTSADYLSDTGYQVMSGTSMATPHVAGLCALMLSKNRQLSQADFVRFVTSTAVQTGLTGGNCGNSTWPNNSFGAGRIDAAKAVAATPAPA